MKTLAKWSVEEYHRMIEAGILHGRSVELLAGEIAEMSPPILRTALRRQMNMPFDLLLGRKTFEIWAPYWPQHADAWPGVNVGRWYRG